VPNTKTPNKLACALALAAMLAAPLAQAGNIAGIRVDPPTATAGQMVTVIVDGQDGGNCGLRLEYGNGDVDVTRMSAGKDNFPRTFQHVFAGPGNFTIIAKGAREGSTLSCAGEAKASIAVLAPVAPPPPAYPPRAGRMAAACPEGFALNRNSLDRRTGAYTCAALQGAELPVAGMACPPGTAYYTNIQGTMAGCKALRRQQ
jgi:hypothetical protein